ncbi:MAG: LysR family transcriptional regulator [Hyphomonadaceae bacterium]|nr:LysR family transcriptional regulator [Hyphomonadaceae bacterium]
MDKLRAIKYFLKVAETGSFSRAAKSFGVPVSSVSRRIQDLETELGAVLFQRSTRHVKLTELGALYRDQVSPAVTAMNDANEVIKHHADTPSGILRITALPGFGRFRLLPALRKLKTLYPGIILDVELTDKVVSLAENQVDIAFRATASPPERSVARKISNNTFILVASPQYLQKHGIPRTAADLQNHQTLLYRGPNSLLYWQVKSEKGWAELRNPVAYISNDGEALVEEARAGSGIGLIPDWGVADDLASGALEQLELEDAVVSVSRNQNAGLYLVYHRPKYSIQKIRLAVDFLLDELTDREKA